MQIHARLQQTGVPRRSLDLGQRSTAGQRMADERVPSVMDRQGAEAVAKLAPACTIEPGFRIDPGHICKTKRPSAPLHS